MWPAGLDLRIARIIVMNRRAASFVSSVPDQGVVQAVISGVGSC